MLFLNAKICKCERENEEIELPSREELGLENRWKEKETAASLPKHETRIILHKLDDERLK